MKIWSDPQVRRNEICTLYIRTVLYYIFLYRHILKNERRWRLDYNKIGEFFYKFLKSIPINSKLYETLVSLAQSAHEIIMNFVLRFDLNYSLHFSVNRFILIRHWSYFV